MKKLLTNTAFGVVLISLLSLAYSCSSDDNLTSPSGTSYDQLTINGRITFPDTSGYYKFTDTANGYYNISAFAQWPPMGPASASSKIFPKVESGKLIVDYKILVPANGFYTVTSAYIRLPYTSGSVYGLGKYGSDTSHNPAQIFDTTNARVSIQGNTGVGGIDFLSWTDTTSKIYTF
ncbi:MAG: hypothetical protein WC644_03820 [Ignavibacteria bacterium]